MAERISRAYDERTPLLRAFVDAFRRATEARAALDQPVTDESAPYDHADGPAISPPEKLAAQLTTITRRFARDAMAWTGAAGESDIADAQYAFVALLDEQLVFSDWAGRADWEAVPLEMRIFGTHIAGERLPDAIDALLTRRDTSQRDLAHVYLACLMLGFRGRLRDQGGALRHDQLRHALFGFAMQCDADPAHIGKLLECAAIPPLEARPLVKMFPDNARFLALVGIGACLLLGLSCLLWWSATTAVRPALQQFLGTATFDGPVSAIAARGDASAILRASASAARRPSDATMASSAIRETRPLSVPPASDRAASDGVPRTGARL
ncbi:ompA family protein [Burkholderia lata]|uniref:OmpA family protein n=1 Tax=Burkholderia lata (strain ATCC 17760 / DSM 23089 / LMG 22485 / NCIMB 9086 / R18194 / 383) TaxID=482957 RepID=A0A6P2SFQ6_BURL3|nr:DotU family type IV/VI secretion system protein [Burkholderia lata]VWC49400.1 ompA family protein [Burkholderia lata]